MGPAQNILAAQFLLFPLKPIRAICFMVITYEQPFFVFLEEKKTEACWVFLEQKTGVCSVHFSGADFAAAVLLLSRILFSQFFRQAERD